MNDKELRMVRMVEWMKDGGLPEPEYEEELGEFSVYFYKDIYAEQNLRNMRLNERQTKMVVYLKEGRNITNKEYQKLYEAKNDKQPLPGRNAIQIEHWRQRSTWPSS